MAKKGKLSRDNTSGRRNLLMNVAHPVCKAAGKLLGMDGERIDDYFIEKNNRIVAASGRKYRPEEVLLIFPHCLQDWECPHRITSNLSNCKACGNCSIPELIAISEKFHVKMEVVAGGTAARRVIIDHRPLFTVAVACERDMISGIQESMPLPVMGILNERPHGPCRNTKVDISLVEETLSNLLNGEAGPEAEKAPEN
jgi:hypothetical protein